jgi:hypothetical protein
MAICLLLGYISSDKNVLKLCLYLNHIEKWQADARHLIYVFPDLADKSTYMNVAHKFPLGTQHFPVFSAHITGISCPASYDTPAGKLLRAVDGSLSKRIAADGEVMSDASYVTLRLHESQIAINKCASRFVALAFFHISLSHFVNISMVTQL